MFMDAKLEERTCTYPRVEINGTIVRVPYPVEIPDVNFVERENLIEKALAAWMRLDGLPPLNFRLYGPPGIGKNALVYKLAQILNKDLYIFNGNEDLRPEDIICTAVMTSSGAIEYVAQPLFAAMLRGGICFFDEIGKASAAALDPLASVLDDRRTLDSLHAGIHLKAHEDFLFCAALNEDEEEGMGLPGFIDERTRPAFHVGYPDSRTMERILRSHLPQAADVWFRVFMDEFSGEQISPRDARTLLTFAYRLLPRGKGEVGEDEVRRILWKAKEDMEPRKPEDIPEPEGEEDERNDKEEEDVGFQFLFQEGHLLH